MWEQIFQIALPAITGALAVGIPLWIQLRKAFAEISQGKATAELQAKERNSQIELEAKKKAQEMTQNDKINVEAEWKRVLNEKDTELVKLRAKDDEQEAKIDNLLTRHIECKQNEARQDERAKFYEKRSEEQGREIKALTSKIGQLEKLIRERLNAPEFPSSEGTIGVVPVQ